MRRTFSRRFCTTSLVLSLGIGCQGRCGKEPRASPDLCESSGVSFPVARDVSSDGPTLRSMRARGHAIVGVKADQPNLGYKDVEGRRCGFDVEVARLVSAGLGLDPTAIEFKEIPSANRESALAGSEIDYYVGTYSITDKRKKDVAFAGPYFVAGQDLLVRRDEASISGPETLRGRKVCSATGSTPIQRVRERGLTEEANIVEFKTYSECVSQLLDGKVDAVTTDDAILKGYAAQNPRRLRVVGKPFSEEKYGIGLPRDDAALRSAMNGVLERAFDDGTWAKVYTGTLGRSGSPASPPKLERY